MNRTMQTKWIALSERIYGALLILYPADYRRDYGELMLQLFRDVSRDRYRSEGSTGIVLWWCKALLDLTVTVFEQRRKVDLTMLKSKFIQLSGSILALGGAFIAAAAFSQFQPDDHYTYYGIFQLLMWLLAPGLLLTGLGCIGIGMRYDGALGRLGRWSLNLTGVGLLVMLIGMIITLLTDDLWEVTLAGVVLHSLALTLFGLLHGRKPALPIFRWLPLQIGLGALVVTTGVLRSDSQTINNTLSFLFFVGMGLAWLAIGLAVNRQQRTNQLATA